MDKHEDTALPVDAEERAAVERDAARLDALPAAKRAEIIRFFDEVQATAAAGRSRGIPRRVSSHAGRIAAEEQALVNRGLKPMHDECARGNVVIDIVDESPIRINAKAHPMTLVATAFSRAQRCEAFADLLARESSDNEPYQLFQLIQEVVQLLDVLVAHPAVMCATWPVGEPDEVQS